MGQKEEVMSEETVYRGKAASTVFKSPFTQDQLTDLRNVT